MDVTGVDQGSASTVKDDGSQFCIGQRVIVDNHRGSIRFIGKAQFSPGRWVGIETDEAVGKNDGEVMGFRYFSCPPEHGLFLQEEMVKALDETELSTVRSAGAAGVDDDDVHGIDSDGEQEEEVMLPLKSIRRGGVSAESVKSSVTSNVSMPWTPPVYDKSPTDRRHLYEIIKTSPDSKLRMMFGGIPDDTFDKVIDAMFLKTVAGGENVICIGDEGDYFYIVKSGKFDILAKRVLEKEHDLHHPASPGPELCKVFEASAGFAFGELALLYNAPRSATVTATMESEVWCLERTAFRNLVVHSAEEQFKQNVEFLRKCDIFQGLDDEQIAALASVLLEEDFEEDEAILEQGDKDSKMYIVRKGKAVACINGDQGEAEVMQYNQGDHFGEIALLLGEPRKASVYAVGPTTCSYISRETFNRTVGPLHEFLKTDIDKYDKYQNAIKEATIRQPVTPFPAEGDQPGVTEEQSGLEVFEGGEQPVQARKSVHRKRTQNLTGEFEAFQKEAAALEETINKEVSTCEETKKKTYGSCRKGCAGL